MEDTEAGGWRTLKLEDGGHGSWKMDDNEAGIWKTWKLEWMTLKLEDGGH